MIRTSLTIRPLASPGGLWDIWFNPGATCQFYPLSFTVFWLDYHLWGLNPLGYHLQNVLLHGTVAVLLWQVLNRLEVRAAWLAGAIFALHPVNVMSVAWATELKNTLAGTLALATVWAFLRFAGLGVYKNEVREKTDWRHGLLLLAIFQLAMFAKTAVCFLPVTLLLLLAWWKAGTITWRQAWPLPVMVGITAGMGLLTLHVEHIKGATGEAFDMTWVERVIISGQSFWFYLGKLFFPYPLTFIYERWKIDTHCWWQYIYPAATLGLLGTLWLIRKRIGKGAFAAMLHFYVATSFLILIQVLYMMRYTFVTDHWQYFGCMSVFALTAVAIAQALDFIPRGSWPIKPAFCGVLLLVLGILTWQQAGTYRTAEILWRDTLSKNPQCWLAHNDLALVLAAQGKYAEAEDHYRRALALKSGEEPIHYNLANLLVKTGRLDEAIVQYQQALELTPGNADFHNNLGSVLLKLHRNDEAIAQLRLAIQGSPGVAATHYNLGNALAAEKKFDEAVAEYREALKLDPGLEPARNRLRALGAAEN